MSFGFGFGLPRAPLRGRPLVAVIRSLFAANEPGVWYDPSDLSTLFQDAAGTTPVTAVEQPVGLMLDKSKGLVLGPELVSALPAGWSATFSATLSTGAYTTTTNGGATRQVFTVGKAYELTVQGSTTAGEFSVNLAGDIAANSRTLIGTGFGKFIFTATTQFLYLRNNSAGTTTISSISVRELPGNHASQPTATSRPVLSARYNLLTKTEQFDDAYWEKQNTTVTPNAVISPDGNTTADKLKETSATGTHTLYKNLAIPANAKVKISVALKAAERSFALVGDGTDAVTVNLTTGIASRAAGTNIDGVTSVSLGDGWFRVSYTITKAANSDVYFYSSIDGVHANRSFAGTTDYGIYIWGADLRVANDGANLPPYQRVNTATDYDTVGFPHYLRFDGVDDWLVTPTITPGIDKVQVFAGVRKLSDAARGIVAELGSGSVAGNDFNLNAPPSASPGYGFRSRGTSIAGADLFTGFPAPTTDVLTGIGDIPGDQAALRVDGTQAASSTADQGTGNYLAYPLYIGRRGGTTLPFNGHIYGLIVRFGSNLPAATIEKTEKYINQKTRAY